MATPYLQIRLDAVASTQDHARSNLGELPVLVVAPVQTAGRGRSGAHWDTAPRALAASLALHVADDVEPLSLIAGLAARRACNGVGLKWPNDVMLGDEKAGGILVERSDDTAVIGLGLNLWWPDRPDGYGAVFQDDPGPLAHAGIGCLWGAELVRLLDSVPWPVDEYREACLTIGRDITWEPDGAGVAVDVAPSGELIVDTQEGRSLIRSGAVRHVRSSRDLPLPPEEAST